MTRRNISLPAELDSRARAAGLNVSALARQALVAELGRQARVARLDAWLDELDEQHGPPSARAMAIAAKWVDDAVPVQPRVERVRRSPRMPTARDKSASSAAKRTASPNRRAAS